MKKTLMLLSLMLGLLAFTVTAQALPYSGTLTIGSGLFGTEPWNSVDTSLSYSVTNNAGLWYYEYTFIVPAKDISHLIIEVSDNFTLTNILTGTTSGYTLENFTQQNGNPGMPTDLYGLKWEFEGGDHLEETILIVSDRAPMLGNFYAKDGNNPDDVDGINPEVYAYTGTENGFGDNIWVPDTDTTPIPEPGTIMLLGCGLLSVAIFSKRRRMVGS